MPAKSLFYSSKFQVLYALTLSPGVSLRELSYRCQLNIRSVQLAINSLLENNYLHKTKDKKRLLFKLNISHPEFPILKLLFSLIEEKNINQISTQIKPHIKQIQENYANLYNSAMRIKNGL